MRHEHEEVLEGNEINEESVEDEEEEGGSTVVGMDWVLDDGTGDVDVDRGTVV